MLSSRSRAHACRPYHACLAFENPSCPSMTDRLYFRVCLEHDSFIPTIYDLSMWLLWRCMKPVIRIVTIAMHLNRPLILFLFHVSCHKLIQSSYQHFRSWTDQLQFLCCKERWWIVILGCTVNSILWISSLSYFIKSFLKSSHLKFSKYWNSWWIPE